MTKDDTRRLAASDAAKWDQDKYYGRAESWIDGQWQNIIWPIISGCDFSHVVDLACGHGRNTTKLLEVADRVTLVDIHESNIEACRQRFGEAASAGRVRFVVNDGVELSAIDDASVSLVYCFDAMVHFDSDVVRAYLREIHRVLQPKGRAFLHHSNYTASPGGFFRENPHLRAFMSRELFAHYARKEGLEVLSQEVRGWGSRERGKFVPDLDCLTLLERPAPV